MSRLPLRLRIALAFALTTTIALLGLGAFIYFGVESTLVSQTRTTLDDQLDALVALPGSDRLVAVAASPESSYAQVLDDSGKVLASSARLDGPLLTPEQVASIRRSAHLELPVSLVGEAEPENALLAAARDGEQVTVIGTSREDISDTLQGVLAKLLVGGPVVLLLASAAGYAVAGSALRPVEQMRRRAEGISANRAEERLPLPQAQDEIRRLGVTLNEMLDRLDAGLKRERRFVAEASHELRTPLSLLRMELDLALAQPRTEDELLDALRSANEEVNRLTHLSESLLRLAEAEGRPSAGPTTTNGTDLLTSLAGRFAHRAAAQRRSIVVRCSSDVQITGDRSGVDRALSNLVDNSLRHGAGVVQLSGSRSADGVDLSVRDEGRFLVEVADTAFEPFTRGQANRGAGTGLGLAIVKAIASAHGGTVTVDQPPEGGSTVTLHLPQ